MFRPSHFPKSPIRALSWLASAGHDMNSSCRSISPPDIPARLPTPLSVGLMHASVTVACKRAHRFGLLRTLELPPPHEHRVAHLRRRTGSRSVIRSHSARDQIWGDAAAAKHPTLFRTAERGSCPTRGGHRNLAVEDQCFTAARQVDLVSARSELICSLAHPEARDGIMLSGPTVGGAARFSGGALENASEGPSVPQKRAWEGGAMAHAKGMAELTKGLRFFTAPSW